MIQEPTEDRLRPQVSYTRIPRDSLKLEYHEQQSMSRRIQEKVRALVTSRPAVTLAVSFATGVLLGCLIKRR